MWTYIIIILISSGLVLGLSGCLPGMAKHSLFVPGDSLFYPSDSSVGNASRADVERRLKALADSPVPDELNPGAMCYEMSVPPDRKEYVCPQCGEKTIYSNTDYFSIIDDVVDCRQLAANIKNLTLRMEEKHFCHQCDSDTNASPSITLYLKYKGESKEEIIENANKDDLDLLWAFMNGQSVHADFYDRETPLKEYIDRISNLLHINKPDK